MTFTNNSVDSGEYRSRVQRIFTEIARDYDRVNTVISFGQIGRWRRSLVEIMEVPRGGVVLDLGCGTGRLSRLIVERNPGVRVVGVDMTPEMVDKARDDLPEKFDSFINFHVGNGEHLDWGDNHFDVVASSFTLRNVSDLPGVISEMRRVVKPEGRVYSLELSKPSIPIFKELYFLYFNNFLPFVGGFLQGKKEPYRYLTESLKKFPDQDKLKEIFECAELSAVEYRELFGGIATIHQGMKRGK